MVSWYVAHVYYYYYYYYHHHYHHHHHHHHHYHYRLKAGYLYIHSWAKPCPRDYSVSAILSSLFIVPISLVPASGLWYFYVSTFRSLCAVPSMVVFCSSFASWFPGILLIYFLNDFVMGEMVPVAPIITGITLVFYLPHTLYFYCQVLIF